MFYALAHDEAYFKQKVSVFVALAPVTKVSHTKASILEYIGIFYDEFEDAVQGARIHNLMHKTWLNTQSEKLFCEVLVQPCNLLEKLMVTNDPDLDDRDRYQVYLGHMPNGVSVKSILHYGQNFR